MSGPPGDALAAARAQLDAPGLDERCAGVAALAGLEGPDATAALVALLDESSWYLRDRVVEALAGRAGATEPLLRVLRDGTWFARASACDALGRRADLAAIPALLEQIEDRNVSLQKSAVEALQRLASVRGEGLVAQAVAGLPPERRRRVVARVGHQAPHWAGALDAALAGLPPESFGAADPTVRRVEPGGARAGAGAAPLVRFRRWLAALPAGPGD